MDKNWPVQDAKARFSEMLRAADAEPQQITYRGVPRYELRRIAETQAEGKSLYDVLRECPYEFAVPPRDKSPGRDVDL